VQIFTPLHAANPGPMTGGGNWTYFVPGTLPTLVDAGVGRAGHLDAIAGVAGAGLAQVLVTHAHGDHADGVAAIAARWPAARFAKKPWPDRDPRYGVPWEPLADGARVGAGDLELEVLHTPGHAPDHLAFWHGASRTLLSGDLLVLGTTVVIPASAGGSLVDYLRSLRRVLALRPARVLPAHGPPIEDPEALVHQYLEHRRHREQQILSALETAPCTLEDLVGRIYPRLPEAIVPMARETVLAHLQKLDHDGLASAGEGRWSVVD
jgi:glyoxylase-like metal-dependent hydrolase (beta-lactamase superfamily II)